MNHAYTHHQYVYIACPYTLGDTVENVTKCIAVADRLAIMGYFPFAPLLFHYWDQQHPHSYGFWINQSLSWLYKCDAVLRIPGVSRGADDEVRHALAAGIPVFYSIEDLHEQLG